MQVYAFTHGLAACLFGIALLGGCNRCSCREEEQPAWTGCTGVPPSVVAQAPPPAAGTTSLSRDLGCGTCDPGSPPQRIIPYPKSEVSEAKPESPKSGPPRAEITFQPIAPQTPTYLPPPAAKLPTPTPATTPAPAPRPDPRFGHAPDYTWLRGQVEYSHTLKEWRLRYAPLGETDANGGRVVLIETNHVSYLVDGEFVHVDGHLVTSQDGRQGPPFYRIDAFRIGQ